jgi:hypothetical protein
MSPLFKGWGLRFSIMHIFKAADLSPACTAAITQHADDLSGRKQQPK